VKRWRRFASWMKAYTECLVEGRDVSLAPTVWQALWHTGTGVGIKQGELL